MDIYVAESPQFNGAVGAGIISTKGLPGSRQVKISHPTFSGVRNDNLG